MAGIGEKHEPTGTEKHPIVPHGGRRCRTRGNLPGIVHHDQKAGVLIPLVKRRTNQSGWAKPGVSEAGGLGLDQRHGGKGVGYASDNGQPHHDESPRVARQGQPVEFRLFI